MEKITLDNITMKTWESLVIEATNKGHYMYPEDDYQISATITNEDDLFKFMKEVHKRDSQYSNDTALNGGFSPNICKYYIQTTKTLKFGKDRFTKIEKIDGEKPEYFERAYEKYKEFNKCLRERLPKIRDAREQRLKRDSDRRKYEELKQKFE